VASFSLVHFLILFDIAAGAVARIEVDVCKGMVERTWRGMLAVISQLLLRSSGEELVLQLLKVRGGACSGWLRLALGWDALRI
jgi:hypothetical protein